MKLNHELKKLLEKQQYQFINEFSAVKICTWTKKSLKDEDFCYKQKFYGIQSHLCCQMSTTVEVCPNRCIFCWREVNHTIANDFTKSYSYNPYELIDKAILAQRKLLSGFGGNKKVNKKKFREAQEPLHFAISLTGEPLADRNLPKLIEALHQRKKTTFVVTNGQFPERMKKINPTQLYLSLSAPNENIFNKVCNPQLPNAWKRFLKSLEILREKKKQTRTAIRLTLIKGMNMTNLNDYASLINIAEPMFLEVKAYMFVGSSRQRLTINNMPRHYEVKEFAKKLEDVTSYKIVDEKKESRVVLMMNKNYERKIRF